MAAMIGLLPSQNETVAAVEEPKLAAMPSHDEIQADKVSHQPPNPPTQMACRPHVAPPMHPPSQPPLQPPAAVAVTWQQQPARTAPFAAALPSAEPPGQPPMQPPSQPPGQPPKGPPTQPPPQVGPRHAGHALTAGLPQPKASLALPGSLSMSAQMDLPGNPAGAGLPQENPRTPATAPPRAPPSAHLTMPPRAPPSAPPSLPAPLFSAPTGPPTSAVAGRPGIQHNTHNTPQPPPGIINGIALESGTSGLFREVVSTAPPVSPRGSVSPAGMQSFQCRPATAAAATTAGVQLPVSDAPYSPGNLPNLGGCSGVADLLSPAPLASHQLPQPRVAYDLAAAKVAAAAPAAPAMLSSAAPTDSVRSPARDATCSAFAAAGFDQANPFMPPSPNPGVLDPSSFNAYDGHQFDTALYQAAYEAALYGASDMPGLPRHPYPFVPQVHTPPWVPTLGLSSEATALPVAAPSAPASASGDCGGNRKPWRDAQGGSGGVQAGTDCVGQQDSLMQAPMAIKSREEGVEILQALLPNTRISVRPAAAATAATATAPTWCPTVQVAASDTSGRCA
mmetsp:Transcript_60700/g.120237  ORF Transcript_60700/g.120237 Transcript_60700/m.120237 type:complete len:564 (+) Transcript_60700:183-1874(+)